MRPIVFLAAVMVLLFGPRAAQAENQDLVFYLTSSNLHMNNVVASETITSTASQERYSNLWAYGFGGGVTYNFAETEHLLFGADARFSVRPGTPGASSILCGVRMGFHTHKFPIKPYVQASLGLVNTSVVNLVTTSNATYEDTDTDSNFTDHSFAYELLGGIDIKLTRRVDLRAIEVGGGQTKSYIVGASGSSLFSIGAGIVFKY